MVDKAGGKAEQTASIGKTAANAANSVARDLPPEVDLAFAKAAAHEVLSRSGKDLSLPWENPRTGARGTVTPIATAYDQAGLTCRDFLASYVHNGTEAWMQGEACRVREGKWEVRALKPWRRS